MTASTISPSSDAGSSASLSQEEAVARSRIISSQLGAIVAIMTRSPELRQLPIGELDILVGPALALHQFAIAEARDPKSGVVVPAAAVTWALVSEAVDQRLADTSITQAKLEPKEWKSGTLPWIITAVGEKNAVNALLKQVIEQRFAASPPKMRLRDKDGNVKVGQLTAQPSDNPSLGVSS